MTNYCKKCADSGITGHSHCTTCGGKLSPMPRCNWCWTELWPYMNNCPGCGRSKYDTINTSPPPSGIQVWWNETVIPWWKRFLGKSANSNVKS